MYSDGTIKKLGDNLVTPFNDKLVQPASYEVTLSSKLILLQRRGEDAVELKIDMDANGGKYTIDPGEFLLASTNEKVLVPRNAVCLVNGKSSWARKGLMIHVTAGFCDPNFQGKVTLEVKNVAPYPITLHTNDRIAQLAFIELDQAAEIPYGDKRLGSHYQHQADVQGNKTTEFGVK